MLDNWVDPWTWVEDLRGKDQPFQSRKKAKNGYCRCRLRFVVHALWLMAEQHAISKRETFLAFFVVTLQTQGRAAGKPGREDQDGRA